jgi:hypothetical protein
MPVQDLRLQEEGRELVYKGTLKKRGDTRSDSAELMVFLFDHALLMVKQKSKAEQYKVYRRVSIQSNLQWRSHSCPSAAYSFRASSCFGSRRFPQSVEVIEAEGITQERSACTSHPDQGGERRILDNIHSFGSQILPDNAVGKYICQPAKVGRTHPEAAGSYAGTEPRVRDRYLERGLLRWP